MAATESRAGSSRAASRSRFGLGTRVFLLTAVLLVAALGASVVFTYVVAERIARQSAETDLVASSRLQDRIREERYGALQLSSYLFVSDPFLAAYIAEAREQQDAASVLDLLDERRSDLGFDFAIVLDPQGRVVARTDRPAGVGQDLSARPLVATAVRDYEAYGVWREGNALYHAVAVPITRGTELLGYLVTGFELTDATALEVKEVSGTEVAYVADGGDGPRVVASTLSNDAETGLLAALGGGGDPLGRLLGGGMEPGTELDLRLRDARWIARLTSLLDAAGDTAGGAVTLTPLDAQLAPYRRIGRVLLVAGGIALLAALALSFPLARRTMAPVRELVEATAAARAGDYDHRIPRQRQDEVGELARTFDDLLSDLREKRDMETYLADVSRTLPEPSPVASPPVEARGGPVTLMAVELRAAAAAGGLEPQRALDAFSADLGRLTQLASARRGRLVALAGHRAWLRFEGDGRTFRAFGCAAELMRSYVEAGREASAPLVGIASGDAVWGAVAWGEERRPTTLGRPVLRLESLLREASPGDVTLSPEAEEELRSSFAAAGLDVVAQRGVVTSQPLFVVQAADAARLLGSHAMPTLATAAGDAPGTAGADLHPTLSAIGPGAVVGGRFEILAVLGAGGMGVVYKARDRELDEVVAVKMLRPDQADVANGARLRDELRLARRITHPNVLRTFDLGEVAGIPFISMEYVRGVTLAQLLEHTDRLTYSAGLSVAKQLCQGLAAAHEVGVLHRDIKPGNLILAPNGNVKLMDFGIARPIRRSEPGQTQKGWLVGTPKYLAPEQLRGAEPDARADIYAVGVVLYEMFTGDSPFHGTSYVELVTQTLNEAPRPPSESWPEVPAELERIVLRCLAKDPAERYPSAAALYADLGRLKA